MKKILALIMILGVMLAAVNAASAAGYDANITVSGNEVGKSVLGLDVEVDNPIYGMSVAGLDGYLQVEALVTNTDPMGSTGDFLFEGTFQADTQYYMYFVLDLLSESDPSEETIEAIKAAKFLFNGKEPVYMGVRSYSGSVELVYELPVNTPAPATGDAASIALWSVLMAAGFAGMVMILRRRRA